MLHVTRKLTNVIRFFLDECIPPVIRDNRSFMYPFFYIWWKGKNIKQMLDFKSVVYSMTGKEFADFYKNIDCIANDRETDLSDECVDFMLKVIHESGAKNLLDVGCGRGYWLNLLSDITKIELTGCDFYDTVYLKRAGYVKANIEELPFASKSYDVVTCSHTLEHTRNLEKAVAELKRVARKLVVIVVPCQRYYYYTLDTHIHFFPRQFMLKNVMNMTHHLCKKIGGDWVYIAFI